MLFNFDLFIYNLSRLKEVKSWRINHRKLYCVYLESSMPNAGLRMFDIIKD